MWMKNNEKIDAVWIHDHFKYKSFSVARKMAKIIMFLDFNYYLFCIFLTKKAKK